MGDASWLKYVSFMGRMTTSDASDWESCSGAWPDRHQQKDGCFTCSKPYTSGATSSHIQEPQTPIA